MTAVLRVKRKNTDTPLDKLVVACKRARTASPLLDESEPAIQTVVQFAATLTDPVIYFFNYLVLINLKV